jgi:hypothetical protein
MKSAMCVVACILLTIPAVVSLNARQTKQQDVHPTKEIVQPKRLSKDELFSQDHTADVVAIEQVWAAYSYYNDTHNGPDMASLFTEDAIVHFVTNNRGKLELNARGGCRFTGRKDIATFYGFNRTTELGPEGRNGLPFPGSSHHMMTNHLVKVSDDGKTAMLTVTFLYTATSDGGVSRMANDGKGSRIAASGTYRNFFRKTSQGWEISELYDGGDPHAGGTITTADSTTPRCDMNGPIPRPSN